MLKSLVTLYSQLQFEIILFFVGHSKAVVELILGTGTLSPGPAELV